MFVEIHYHSKVRNIEIFLCLWKKWNTTFLWYVIVKYYYNLKFVNIYKYIVIYSCDGKATFSALLVQPVTWSFRNHSNTVCWFGAQEIFILINVENRCAEDIFVDNKTFLKNNNI